MKPLRAADLRNQVTIQRPVQADDGRGGYTTAMTVLAKPWAEVVGQDGRESVMEHVLLGISVYRIRIWYRDGIDTGDQVLIGGKVLNIRSCADPYGTRRELLIMADTAGTLP